MNQHVKSVVPFSLKDAPSLIERVFPSMKISAEAQKERKANLGQTLTVLGSYWKGRKPLFLVRACVLGSLLPSTDRPEEDLAIFELLMGIADCSFRHRVKKLKDFPSILDLPYDRRVQNVLRPEEAREDLYSGVWPRVNAHLSTNAHSLPELVEQLGFMRFGRRPAVADTFSGGGSIPFEAARVGCDVFASDINPVACMLTWGSINVLGADAETCAAIQAEQRRIATEFEQAVIRLGVEHDAAGNRAKAYLYCVEVTCPETGWKVPVLPSFVISKNKNAAVKLIPKSETKTYDFEVVSHLTGAEISRAEQGTLVNGRLVHPMGPQEGVSLSTIRGDYKSSAGITRNRIRPWEKKEFVPRGDDVFRERLYAIHWIAAASISKARQETFFSAPTDADLEREALVERLVAEGLSTWQEDGLIPDIEIEPGQKTDEPIRTRGWTYWHHLFGARHLLLNSIYFGLAKKSKYSEYLHILGCRILNVQSRMSRWSPAVGHDLALDVFYNQALNTFLNYGSRASISAFRDLFADPIVAEHALAQRATIANQPVAEIAVSNDIYITDPPYADAVNYHEIYEYFIAWLRKSPPGEFAAWNWDSRRRLAIKGKGEAFRASMVDAYKAMADHMPDNGIQIVMFTHQDGKVWSDMAQIFWGAGLQVMADWYIATETTSDLKKGGYVQGTHVIILRKRAGSEAGYADEITQEVKEEVARQIEEMVGLNQTLRGRGRSENVFNDADLQMAGYAAALRILTRYARIDGKDMTVEALRPRTKNERTVIDDIIEYAVQVANEHLVPEGMEEATWRRLTGTERFYLKMLDIESTGAKKVDNYQNFAKAFRVADYAALMASVEANKAALKSAKEFGKRQMGADEFGASATRALLYALWEMASGIDDETVLRHVRDMVPDYHRRRADLIAIAGYIQAKRKDSDREESQNAEVLAGLIKNERIG